MTDIKKVLIIGSGPIVIGQAAEFDYAGTQACKSLMEEGIYTILVNSNPATIMTDSEIADRVYIEPLTTEVLERIIQREKPDGILPTLGGQTGLNLAVELFDKGILDKYNVKLLGTPLETIRKSEDRKMFSTFLKEIGEPEPPNTIVNSMEESKKGLALIGLPAVVRPAYTLGGTGGGIATTESEFFEIVRSGLQASPISQVLIERSLVGWKEIEYEVIRDREDNCITVCNMENFDPMGAHTGDSIVIAPSQTLSDKEYQMLRSVSLKIIRGLGIEGGCNIQMALRPNSRVETNLGYDWSIDSDYYVIEVNPRVSRSSALASKATGYPIARVSAKIAIGKTLDEITNKVTEKTGAAFEPALDYCVVKIPRWPFDKFPSGDRTLTTQMKATGEVMAIDRSFESAIQKAVRSLELDGRNLFWCDPEWERNYQTTGDISSFPLYPHDLRLWAIIGCIQKGFTTDEIIKHCHVDPWFIEGLRTIVNIHSAIETEDLSSEKLLTYKKHGFTDLQIANIKNVDIDMVRKLRVENNIKPVYKMVDTCAAEFEAVTPYYYSTYEKENEALPLEGPKALVVGSGPIRIGQGIEFDYCSVHASKALFQSGVASIMVNSNPETVSTDFDSSSRLYFEPLDEESIIDILENERTDMGTPPVVVQFGGQTAINLSQSLDALGYGILGSTAEAIDIASDRDKFELFLEQLNIPKPEGSAVNSVNDALRVAGKVGFPVVVRPSYVLGGRAMEIVHNEEELMQYLKIAADITPEKKVLIDRYVEGKECEVDAICDGKEVLIPGIMEHIERAGVHSGDSMAIYPGLNLTEQEVTTIVEQTTKIGLALNIRGLMNIQFVISGSDTYRSPSVTEKKLISGTLISVIEVNPRASRTIPFISKVTGLPVATIATKVMLGDSIHSQGYTGGLWPKSKIVGIKAPVFSMSKLVGVDTYLSPEMKSTGEVMGIDDNFKSALKKTLIAANLNLTQGIGILLSLSDHDKTEAKVLITMLHEADCQLFATEGTAEMIRQLGVPVTMITKKLGEGHPNVLDVIAEGNVKAVINTVSESSRVVRAGFYIRRAAVERRIPCFTSIDTAMAAAESISDVQLTYNIKATSEYVRTTSQ
jgi:carbamoyl-phosphate synthase large subunit